LKSGSGSYKRNDEVYSPATQAVRYNTLRQYKATAVMPGCTYDPASKLFFIFVSSSRSPDSPTSPNRVMWTSASVPAPRLLLVNTVTLYLLTVHPTLHSHRYQPLQTICTKKTDRYSDHIGSLIRKNRS